MEISSPTYPRLSDQQENLAVHLAKDDEDNDYKDLAPAYTSMPMNTVIELVLEAVVEVEEALVVIEAAEADVEVIAVEETEEVGGGRGGGFEKRGGGHQPFRSPPGIPSFPTDRP